MYNFRKYQWVFQQDEKVLLEILFFLLLDYGYHLESRDLIVGKKFIYGEGDIPVVLCAHVDTVHSKEPYQIALDEESGIMWSPQGIGADDRAGVALILEILERGYRPHIAFLDEEESGGGGARELIKEVSPTGLLFALEFDRKNGTEFVTYDCDNKDFNRYIESFGLQHKWGSFSDISLICPAWGVAGANLSVGFHDAHSKTEYLDIKEWTGAVNKTEKIINNLPEERFGYVEKTYGKIVYFKGKQYNSYEDADSAYNDMYYGAGWWDEREQDNWRGGSGLLETSVYTTVEMDPEELSDLYGGTVEAWTEWLEENELLIKEQMEDYLHNIVWESGAMYDIVSGTVVGIIEEEEEEIGGGE